MKNEEQNFKEEARKLEVWGRDVRQNRQKVTAVEKTIKQVRKNQKKLAKDLETIKSEQKDMESNLKDTFMQYTQNNPPGMAGPGPRKEMTQVQETNRELDSTCLDIVKLIEDINSVNSKDADKDSPIYKITKLLSEHESALSNIEQQSEKLKKDISKLRSQGGVHHGY